MKKKILIFGVVSAIYIIFFPFLYHKVFYKQYIIEIIPTCEKNKESLGNEVWINRIIIDGEESDLSQYILADGWENRGRLFSTGITESNLILEIHAKETIVIEFVSHPYSGIVKLQDYNGNVDTVDLYSDTEGYLQREFIIYN